MAIVDEIRTALAQEGGLQRALELTIDHFRAETGTVHLLETDGLLHLKASKGMPDAVMPIIRRIPVGKGMAGLAAERRQPVTVCNIQTDQSGDVRPGAKLTGMEGAIVVPIFQEERVAGTLGIANHTERTFSEEETASLIEIGRILAG